MKYILIAMFVLIGCATPPKMPVKDETTFDEKRRKDMENCVIRLLKEGIHEQLVYPVCKDIHQRRKLIQKQNRHHEI